MSRPAMTKTRFANAVGLISLLLMVLFSGNARSAEDFRIAGNPSGTETSWSMPLQVSRQVLRGENRVIRRLSDMDTETLQQLKNRRFLTPEAAPYTAERDTSVETEVVSVNQMRALAPAEITEFEGVDNADQPDSILRRPPDPIIAAGPNHVVTMVNSFFTVYSKDGTELQQANLVDWFNNVCPGCFPFDPRIIYDPYEDHWIMVAVELDDDPDRSQYLLSVSQGPDPTGDWWNWALDASLIYPPTGEDTWADYPDLGFDGIPGSSGGAIYLTSNQFTFGTRLFRTAVLNILPKSALYSGSGFSHWMAWGQENSDGSDAATLRAAATYGNPGGQFLINSKNNANFVTVWRVNPTFTPVPVDWTRQGTFSIGSYSVPPNAYQLGCSSQLDTIDNRIYNAVWRNNRLYAAFTQAHNWGSGTVAAIHYVKINTSTNSVELNEIYGADGFHYFLPAITTDDSENIVLVFARSSPSEFAGIRYTGLKTGETSLQPSALLKAGEHCVTGFRWGDYFGASVDPVDSSRVWIYGEWAADIPGITSAWDWGTWIGQVTFAGGHQSLANDTPEIYSEIPKDFSFEVKSNAWCGVAINPSTAHDIRVDDDLDFGSPYESSTDGGTQRDFVVTNGHVWGDAVHYAQVYGGSPSNYTIEAEWEAYDLSFDNPYSDTMEVDDVLQMYEVSLAQGENYHVSLSVLSGNGDTSIQVFKPSRNSGSRVNSDWSVDSNGAGGDESLCFTADAAGDYGIAVINENNDSANYTIIVTGCSAPAADFMGTPTNGCAPMTVDFTDQSTESPTIWSWNFGDGETSDDQNPSHIYTDPGTYTVTLKATNVWGAGIETKTDYIVAEPCVNAEFRISVGLSHGKSNGFELVDNSWDPAPAWDLPDVGAGANSAFADLDGDGDQDAIVGDSTGIGEAYENLGSNNDPVWTRMPGWDLPDAGSYGAPALADLDGDGDQDALMGNNRGEVRAYINDGSANAPLWSRHSPWDLPDVGGYADPVLVDMDNDGDMDLLVAEANAGVKSYENVGGASGPVWVRNETWDGPKVDYRTTVAAGDLDGDGDIDLMLGHKLGSALGYENTGSSASPVWARRPSWDIDDLGSYSAPALVPRAGESPQLPQGLMVTPADGMIASGPEGGPFSPECINYTVQNTGEGQIAWSASKTEDWLTLSDTGGILDAGDSTPVAVCMGGSATGLPPNEYHDMVTFTNEISGDGNTTRDVSLTINQAWTANLVVCASDGKCRGFEYTDGGWTPSFDWDLPDVGAYANAAFADLDGDEDLDALVGDSTGIGEAFVNTGSCDAPVWSRISDWDLPDVGSFGAPALADLDGDGDTDAFMGNNKGQVHAFRNDGSTNAPVWTRYGPWDLPDVGGYADPVLVDMDNDGDMDLLVGEANAGVLGYRNDGNTSAPLWVRAAEWDGPKVNYRTTVTAADLANEDSDIDLILGEKLGSALGYENTGAAGSPVWVRQPAWDVDDLGSYSAPALVPSPCF